MADIQQQFEKFHATIRVDYDMSQELREKRDIVVAKVQKYLRDNQLPGVRVLLQGSYKMKTGSQPIADLEYDIDIGLRFDFNEGVYTAAEVRRWIYEAVKDHTHFCDDKGPCIRVVYEKGFHLDLVAYCVWTDAFGREQYRLAHKDKGWREADPPKLLDHVSQHRERFQGTDDNATKTDQFRRCVRALRRWNDVRTPYEDEEKPAGLAYVLLACEKLNKRTFLDGRPDDRKALEEWTRSASQTFGRISVIKPTPEHEDMFGRVGDEEMDKLKADLAALANDLRDAGTMADPVEACKVLQKHFGEDFPVPKPEETGRKTSAPAITTSSVSA